MWKSKAIVMGFIVGLGVTFPFAAWAGMEHNCGGHSTHQSTETTHEHGSASGQKHDARTTHEHSATDAIFENYFDIRASLAQDSLRDVSKSANALAKAIEDCASNESVGTDETQKAQRSLEAEMAKTARELAKKTDIESARTEFGKLSSQMYDYREMSGMTSNDIHAFVCDMAQKMWLQESDDPGNPYYGRSMAKCARKIE